MEFDSEGKRWEDKKGMLMQKDTIRIFFPFHNPPFHIFSFLFTTIFGYNSNLKFFFGISSWLSSMNLGKRSPIKSFPNTWTKSLPLPIMSKNKFKSLGSRLDFGHLKKETIKAQLYASKCLISSPDPSFQ
jgi:hypothetical protein